MRHTLFLLLISINVSLALVQLKTTTTIGVSSQKVQQFLATPSNWPRIVLSSWSVQGDNTAIPLKHQSCVKEIFGLPPVLPLCVDWKCVKSTRQTLDMTSQEGVAGLASDCRMLFEIQQQNDNDTAAKVTLTMEYEPCNIIGILAKPVLVVDNAIALKVLLPNELQIVTPLLEFQRLMGNVYGIAGTAHFVDLAFGDSQILQLAGCPSFHDFGPQGKALALLWCAMGPAALVTSRIVGLQNVGIILYGVVEVACAALVSYQYSSTSGMDPLVNALGVQALVAVSYVYSSLQQEKGTNEQA